MVTGPPSGVRHSGAGEHVLTLMVRSKRSVCGGAKWRGRQWVVNRDVCPGPPAEAHPQQTRSGCWRQSPATRDAEGSPACRRLWPPARCPCRWPQARLGNRESGQKSWPIYGAAVSSQESFYPSPCLYEIKNTHLTVFARRRRITS